MDLDLEVDLGSGVVRASPVELLRPDTTYVLRYDPERLGSSHHLPDVPDDAAEATFRTGPGLRLLDALPRDDGSLAIVFSEPVDPRRVLHRVEIVGEEEVLFADGAEGLEPHVVVLTGDLREAVRVRVHPGLVAASGAVLDRQMGEPVDGMWPFDLDVWTGRPDCARGRF